MYIDINESLSNCCSAEIFPGPGSSCTLNVSSGPTHIWTHIRPFRCSAASESHILLCSCWLYVHIRKTYKQVLVWKAAVASWLGFSFFVVVLGLNNSWQSERLLAGGAFWGVQKFKTWNHENHRTIKELHWLRHRLYNRRQEASFMGESKGQNKIVSSNCAKLS